MGALDPFELAARQVELDRENTARPDSAATTRLFNRKRKRLQESPLGFLRGSARLFYEILAREPTLALEAGPRGAVVGDMHLENVGAYRNDADEIVFHLNDFDDAGVAPLWVDTLRLATSVLLAGRSFQATANESLDLVHDLLASYEEALAGCEVPATLPRPIADLCERAARRTRKELLDMRVPIEGGKRRFVRGDRYFDLEEHEREALPALVEAYRAALGGRAPSHAATWSIQDAVHRVAGNGSLGRRRIALLLVDEKKDERLFELKEAKPSALDALFPPSGTDPASRVVDAARSLVTTPHRQLAALPPSSLGSFLGRKLCPEEDKLDLAQLSVGKTLSQSSGPSARSSGARTDEAPSTSPGKGVPPPSRPTWSTAPFVSLASSNPSTLRTRD